MTLPDNTWSEISGDVLTIGCTNGPTKWSLKCRGNHWIGMMQSCLQKKETETITYDIEAPNPKSVIDTSPEDEAYYCELKIW